MPISLALNNTREWTQILNHSDNWNSYPMESTTQEIRLNLKYPTERLELLKIYKFLSNYYLSTWNNEFERNFNFVEKRKIENLF